MFSGAIWFSEGHCAQPCQGGHIHDVPSISLEHSREDESAQLQSCRQIDGDDLINVIVREVLVVRSPLDARIVDQHIDGPEASLY